MRTESGERRMDLGRWLHREHSLTITTNIGCVNDCVYCPQRKVLEGYETRGGPRSLTLNDYQDYLRKIPPSVKIAFGGFSEPWGNPNCTKMLLLAHERGHEIDVYTTLVGMSVEDIHLIKDIPFESVFVVHLPDNEGHAKIKVSQLYIEVLRELTAAKVKNLYLVLQQYGKNKASLHHQIVEVLRSSKVYVDSCHTWAGLVGDKTVNVGWGFPYLGGCPRFYRNVLLPNGEVILCCWDMGLKHVLGNLKEKDYNSIFQSKEFARIKTGFSRKDPDVLCSHCDTPLQQILALSVPPAYRSFVKFLLRK
jgi:hypothetical protein